MALCSAANDADTADSVTVSRRAAACTLPVSATAANVASWLQVVLRSVTGLTTFVKEMLN